MGMEERLIVGITIDDPTSIGPEIAVKVLSLEEIYRKYHLLVIGDANVMEATVRIMGKNGIKIHPIHSVDEALFEPGTINVYDMGLVDMDQLERGKVSAMAGETTFRYIEKVIQMVLAGEANGTITNAFSRGAINLTGHHYSGHTEVYADMTGTRRCTTMLAHENTGMVHVSTHVSLREACERVKKDRVLEVIRTVCQVRRSLGIQQSKIDVAGLNPHSGENDLFGREEIEEIIPAIGAANGGGIFAEGPVPPDTVFSKARGGWCNMVMTIYHGQGHIPLKVIEFVYNQEQQRWDAVAGVNIMLGLPTMKASVDHGTAFDQAGQGVADELSLMNAVNCGIRPSKNNREKTVKKQQTEG